MACPRCVLHELVPDERVITLEEVGGFILGFLLAGAGVALGIRRWNRVP